MNTIECIEKYCHYFESTGKPSKSIRGYHYTLNQFFRNKSKNIHDISQEQLVEFLIESGKSKNTLYTRFSRLKNFYVWLKEEEIILSNPLENIPKVRYERTLPKKVMTKGEANKVFQYFEADINKPISFRNRLMIELLYSSSLRRSEVVQLQLKDYDPDTGSLKVRQNKTKKMKVVPIGEQVIQLLETYLSKVRSNSRSKTMFLSKYNRPISADYFSAQVKKAVKETKIRTKASSHSFRKTSATEMLKNGARIESVQQLLGHSCIASTQAYTKLHPKDLIKMHRSKHPREKQKNQKLPELKVPEMLTSKIRFKPLK